jgi:bla regulator protein BlaR1
MIAFLLKSMLFSGLFLAVYYLVLEKEKMHRFNRFYLLFAILFSILAPFLSIHSYSTTLAPMVNGYRQFEENISRVNVHSQPMKNTTSFFSVLLMIYIGICLILFLRLLYILYGFYIIVRKNTLIQIANARLILLNKPVSPHTFLHYIFLSKEDYVQMAIEPEIIAHETAHVRQKHSLDILLLELVLVFCWINPIFFLYRKAIQLNHEYLADDTVIKPNEDISAYQYLLINKAAVNSTSLLPSHFNFLTIKKRLTMMTKTTSRKKALLMQWAIAPLITGICLSFCIKTIAQEKQVETPPKFEIGEFTSNGASEPLMKEFDDIVTKHRRVKSNGITTYTNFTLEEHDRLETIFKLMSRKQQKSSIVFFVAKPDPPRKIIPREKDLEDYADPKKFGVWINNRKVSSETLKKYKASDFSYVYASRLYGEAQSRVHYQWQIDLLTNDFYTDFVQREKNNKRYVMMIKMGKSESSYKVSSPTT